MSSLLITRPQAKLTFWRTLAAVTFVDITITIQAETAQDTRGEEVTINAKKREFRKYGQGTRAERN